MVWAEADTGHHTPGRWLPRYKAADNLGSGTLVTRSLLVIISTTWELPLVGLLCGRAACL